jgi:ankyrin repeat protein
MEAAAAGGQHAVDMLLFIYGVNRINVNLEGKTTAHLAAAAGHTQALRALVNAAPALATTADKKGLTPAHDAAKVGSAKSIDILHSAHANLDAKDDEGNTPLILAAASNFEGAVAELIEDAVDVNAANKLGETAVIAAARAGSFTMIEALRKAGADLAHADNAGNTVISVILASNDDELAKLACFTHDFTACFDLATPVSARAVSAAEAALYGAAVKCDVVSATALVVAHRFAQVVITRALAKAARCASVDTAVAIGLRNANAAGAPLSVEVILNALTSPAEDNSTCKILQHIFEADSSVVNKVDAAGDNACAIVAAHGSPAHAAVLRRFQADCTAVNAEGRSAFHIAAASGNAAVVAFQESLPDVVVLDMLLPKRSGFLVLEKIRHRRLYFSTA